MLIRTALLSTIIAALTLFPGAGCARQTHNPALATRPYPAHLHRAESIDIQVFREGTMLEVVNTTPRSYHDFDLWVNQRFVRHVESLPAGETVRLSLRGFYDELGEPFRAGGFFRTEKPMPVRLVEMQFSEEQPMIGLITIRAEKAE
ncbi:MAG: hypothetical protein SYC29_02085 [Planctomycetota bacterium]|nr:hypothetical protein [Planctomycetota bacterium]